MNDDLAKMFSSFPDMLTTDDLVKIGLFEDSNKAYLARYRGNSPDYIKINRKIFYLKSSVISFLELHSRKGNECHGSKG